MTIEVVYVRDILMENIKAALQLLLSIANFNNSISTIFESSVLDTKLIFSTYRFLK